MDLDAIVSKKQTSLRAEAASEIAELLIDDSSLAMIIELLNGHWIRGKVTVLRRHGLVTSRPAPRTGIGSSNVEYHAVDGLRAQVVEALELIKHTGQRHRIASSLGFVPDFHKTDHAEPVTPEEREHFSKNHLALVGPFIRFSNSCRTRVDRRRYLIDVIEALRQQPRTRQDLRDLGFTKHQVRRCIPYLLKSGMAYTLRGNRISFRREFLSILDFHKSHLVKHAKPE